MRYYTMNEAIKITGISKNTIIRWEQSGRIKVRRDPLFNFRIWTQDEVKALKKMRIRER
jgi:hypothetical protein